MTIFGEATGRRAPLASIGRFTIRSVNPIGSLEITCNWCGTVEVSKYMTVIDDFRRRHVCPKPGDPVAYVLPEGVEWR